MRILQIFEVEEQRCTAPYLAEQLEPGVAVIGGEHADNAGHHAADVVFVLQRSADLEHGAKDGGAAAAAAAAAATAAAAASAAGVVLVGLDQSGQDLVCADLRRKVVHVLRQAGVEPGLGGRGGEGRGWRTTCPS